uniref:Nitric oxide associated 1 n=2 Tax=Gouania willdenowi TaxID=441366 RepID=A0A8C5H716_GOUWI
MCETVSHQKRLTSHDLGGDSVEAELSALIQEAGFSLEQSLLSSSNKKQKQKKKKKNVVFGSADVNEPISDVACVGCGALLHCAVPELPGFLPMEKYHHLKQEAGLSGATCQRCHHLTYYTRALRLQLSPDKYREVVQSIRPLSGAVVLLVDLLLLPDPVLLDLPDLLGPNKHLVVVGNKVDMLPADAPNYLQRLKRQLFQYCCDAGLAPKLADVHLISAKTGYGVEELITGLQRKRRCDVYLVGGANSGKSTLFNALLESDYCKTRTEVAAHRATISPWPGTTLGMLKFPILNPTPYRMSRRQERLQMEDKLSLDEQQQLKRLSRHGYLIGRVGRTFRVDGTKCIEFDPDSLAFSERDEEEKEEEKSQKKKNVGVGLNPNDLKDARWFHDTPGILRENDVLNVLTEQEVPLVVPTRAVVPRTFILKPQSSLFIGGLFRVDFLEGGASSWFSVMASNRLPVHVTSLEKADAIYEKHRGGALLGVPLGGEERMKSFPVLVPQEVKVEGRGYLEAATDITLTSAGWVAVTAPQGEQLILRVFSPLSVGVALRAPLLPHVVTLKGQRIKCSTAYKPMKVPAKVGGASRRKT